LRLSGLEQEGILQWVEARGRNMPGRIA
jgi:hypothetical protein